MSSSNIKAKQSPGAEAASRKQRVQRLKKTLIIGAVVLILIPIIACIFLAIKVNSLQKQIDYLYEARFGNGTLVSERRVNRLAGSEGSGSYIDSEPDDTAPVGRRKVYLTFDDGPSSNTEAILEVLDKYNVKATFFVVGTTDEDLVPLYKKIVDSGNSIGLHSYSHQYSKIYKDLDSFKEDFHKIQDYVKELTGVKTVLYRFPGGSSNQVSNVDMAEFVEFLNSEGVVYFDWNAATGDATSKKYTVKELVNNAINGLNQKGNTILLMHDASNKGTTVEALPVLIEKLQSMDVDIVPIDMSTKPIQHVSVETVEE